MLCRGIREWTILSLVASAVLLVRIGTASADYSNPPQQLVDKINETLDTMIEEGNTDALDGAGPSILAFVGADAAVRLGLASKHTVARYNYFAATSRTDQQIEAPSGEVGSTTLVEKPGLPTILGLAVGFGAIEQERAGSSVTLSGTPYGAIVAISEDSAANYQKYGFLDRLGLTANFVIDDNNEVEAKDLESLGVKLRICGDRSTRTSELQREWEANVQPLIQERLNSLTGLLAVFFNSVDGAGALKEGVEVLNNDLEPQLAEKLDTLQDADEPAKAAAREEMRMLILNTLADRYLARLLSAPDADGHIAILTKEDERLAFNIAVDRMVKAHAEIAKAEETLRAIIEKNQRSQILTTGYALHRQMNATDFSELKLLYETPKFKDLINVIGNANVALNHDPGSEEDSVRSFGASVSLELEIDAENPIEFLFQNPLMQDSAAPITAALSGGVSRLENANRTVGTAQLKINLPVAAGTSLPISFSYTSGTETSSDSEFRVSVAGGLNFDQLAALALQLRAQSR